MVGMVKVSGKGRGHRVYGEFLWAFEVHPLLKAARSESLWKSTGLGIPLEEK